MCHESAYNFTGMFNELWKGVQNQVCKEVALNNVKRISKSWWDVLEPDT